MVDFVLMVFLPTKMSSDLVRKGLVDWRVGGMVELRATSPHVVSQTSLQNKGREYMTRGLALDNSVRRRTISVKSDPQ